MNGEITSSGKIMEQIFGMKFNNTTMELPNVWKSVVSTVGKPNPDDEITFGEKLANNSHVIDLKNGVLLVEANHPGWVQYLKMYQRYILRGLNKKLPNLEIKNLAFRVAGSQVSLSDSYEEGLIKEQEKFNKKMEETEKKLDSIVKPVDNKNKGQLPQDLLDKFESIKESMLTNSQK